MRPTPLLAAIAIAFVCSVASAQDPKPEIARATSTPQAIGTVHTLRTIPEACARIEGRFTGQAAEPYKFAVVRTSPNCQQRARLVDAKEAKPDKATGWIFNDVIRVPSAACPSQQAVVRLWRKPLEAAPPALDAQGRSRIYLKEATDAAKAKAPVVPLFAAAMAVEGTACTP